MPLYIFECENCGHLIKQSLEKLTGKRFTYDCPKCVNHNSFKLIREGDPQMDWLNNILKIHNNRRREVDRLHRTDERKDEDANKD